MDGHDYARMELSWDRLCCEVPSLKDPSSKVDILKNVSGVARSGSILSLMGPSGAGKTSLMDVLAGRMTAKSMKITGDLLVNGRPPNLKLLRKSMCYVMQQDNLPFTETVRECLQFNAALRLPKDMPQGEKDARVDATLKELGLDGCADTLIGSHVAGIKGISGGQMRRLSVAQELITSPSAIFLDEPTSGLDSEIAVTIMQTLAGLASRGRTIMLTIHQPNSDISELFDDFILMARGRVVYGGPWSGAVSFFESAGYVCPAFKNPTDFFMRVITHDSAAADKLIAQQESHWASTRRLAFDKSRKAMALDAVAVSVDPAEEGDDAVPSNTDFIAVNNALQASPLAQARHLTARNFRMWRRHPLMIAGEGIQYLFLALFVGGMYFDLPSDLEYGVFERGAGVFYILVTVVFTPPFTAITMYNAERALLRREVDQCTYSLNAFYTGKFLTLLLVEATASLGVSVISYFMFGLQSGAEKFLVFFLVIFLALLISEAIGVLFALINKTAEMAIVFVSLCFIITLSFTGFLIPKTPVYYEWLQHLSFLRYANSALFINEMQGLTLYDGGLPVTGSEILVGHPLNNGLSVWENVGVLAGIFVFLKIVGLVGLHVAHRQKWL